MAGAALGFAPKPKVSFASTANNHKELNAVTAVVDTKRQSNTDGGGVGVLLLNLGGPERSEDVEPFLYNLFADPDIIRLPSSISGYRSLSPPS